MKTFTIENETNNITIHITVQDAEALANAERFRNEAGLAKLAADWPAAPGGCRRATPDRLNDKPRLSLQS